MLSHYTPTPSISQVYDQLPDTYMELIAKHEAKGNIEAAKFIKQQLKTIYDTQARKHTNNHSSSFGRNSISADISRTVGDD